MNQNDDTQSRSRLNQFALILVLLVVIACAAGWYFLVQNSDMAEPEPVTEVAPVTLPEEPLPVAPLPEPEPEVLPEADPVPSPEPESVPEPEPLPSLDNSDPFAQEQLQTIADGMQIDEALKPDNLVRRLTVFIDNLASGEVMRQQGPFEPLEQEFIALEVNNSLYLDPAGYRRYDKYADFIEQLDVETLYRTFERTEPLLESAYQELGYPAGQLRSALIDAIDLLLRAPEYEQPLLLESHSVNYRYADPQVEALPDAHKLMIRMGPDNTRKVKSFLRRFKELLEG
ncbi:DUF3014 domain-containing protein [Ferrimonas gelatinilytica]|uniref:DUF3014 domain-containing protein n=1 Tax=Ferrimonas gelatinilytica TaxID=1255257 RepID=A0ABP9SB64_9GAMM